MTTDLTTANSATPDMRVIEHALRLAQTLADDVQLFREQGVGLPDEGFLRDVNAAISAALVRDWYAPAYGSTPTPEAPRDH